MEEKKCTGCGELKPVDEYYIHPRMSGGHVNRCKDCYREYSKKRRADNAEKIRAYDRQRDSLPHRVKARKEYAEMLKKTGKRKDYERERRKRYAEKNPEKKNARALVWYHLNAGNIKRLPCEVCGVADSQAHHEDYSKPLDIMWLCCKHHNEIHVNSGSLRKSKGL